MGCMQLPSSGELDWRDGVPDNLTEGPGGDAKALHFWLCRALYAKETQLVDGGRFPLSGVLI